MRHLGSWRRRATTNATEDLENMHFMLQFNYLDITRAVTWQNAPVCFAYAPLRAVFKNFALLHSTTSEWNTFGNNFPTMKTVEILILEVFINFREHFGAERALCALCLAFALLRCILKIPLRSEPCSGAKPPKHFRSGARHSLCTSLTRRHSRRGFR